MKWIKLFLVLASLWMICVLIGKELMREGLWLWKFIFWVIEMVGGANLFTIIAIIFATSPIWSTFIIMFYLWTKSIEPQEDYLA